MKSVSASNIIVYRLVKLPGKPCYIIINKEDSPYPQLDKFCAENGLPILARIPFDSETALLFANDELLYGYYTDLS